MSSREGAEYLIPEVLMCPAAEEDVSDSLPPLAALATGASDIWHSLAEEKVIQPDLFSAHLHQQCALSFAEPLVELENLLNGPWCVSVGCSTLSL